MKKYKKLNIRGTLLDRNQLAKHIEKTAADHNTKSFSNKNTYPISNLIDDYNKRQAGLKDYGEIKITINIDENLSGQRAENRQKAARQAGRRRL